MGPFDALTAPVERRVIVAFADMERFARLASTMTARAVFDMLDGYYEHVAAAVEAGGGAVVKFMGDGAFVVFPDDEPLKAVESLRTAKARAETWLSRFAPACRVLVKAHIGTAVCGPMGGAGRKRLDVIGATVIELFRAPAGDFELSAALRAELGGGPAG